MFRELERVCLSISHSIGSMCTTTYLRYNTYLTYVCLEHTASKLKWLNCINLMCMCLVFMSGVCVSSAERQDCPCSVFCVQYLELESTLNWSCLVYLLCTVYEIPRCLTVSLSHCLAVSLCIPSSLYNTYVPAWHTYKGRTTTRS